MMMMMEKERSNCWWWVCLTPSYVCAIGRVPAVANMEKETPKRKKERKKHYLRAMRKAYKVKEKKKEIHIVVIELKRKHS